MNLIYGKNSPFSRKDAKEIWRQVSLEAAKRASGEVRSVVGQVHPRSVYQGEIREVLLNNPKVTGLDELQMKPRIIFKR